MLFSSRETPPASVDHHYATSNCRQFVVADYADEGTRLYYGRNSARLFGLVKPDAMSSLPALVTAASKSFSLSRLRLVRLDGPAALRFGCSPGDTAMAMEAAMVGSDASLGPKWEAFASSYGMYTAVSAGSASEDADCCFEELPAATGTAVGPRSSAAVTCCLVKPHAVKEGLLGPILAEVAAEDFEVQACEMLQLDVSAAESFFDPYKGIFPHYAQVVAEAASGPAVFLKLVTARGACVEKLRELMGPGDVDLARTLRPKSLRARMGTDRVRNLVHCTDLPMDGDLECRFFAHLLGM